MKSHILLQSCSWTFTTHIILIISQILLLIEVHGLVDVADDGKTIKYVELDKDYRIYQRKVTWKDALEYCVKCVGTFATFPEKVEAEKVKTLIYKMSVFSEAYDSGKEDHEWGLDRRYWFGLSDEEKETEWKWISTSVDKGESAKEIETYDWYMNQPDHIKGKTDEHCGGFWNPVYHLDTGKAGKDREEAHSFNDFPCDSKHYFICKTGDAEKAKDDECKSEATKPEDGKAKPVEVVEGSTGEPGSETTVEGGDTTGDTTGTEETATGETTAAEGETTAAAGETTAAEGETTTTAEGETTAAEGETTAAEGETTAAAEGEATTAAEGETTAAAGETTAAAEGETTTAAAEGETTAAAEGETTAAAEGETTTAAAEGETTTAAAEGETTAAAEETTTAAAETTAKPAGRSFDRQRKPGKKQKIATIRKHHPVINGRIQDKAKSTPSAKSKPTVKTLQSLTTTPKQKIRMRTTSRPRPDVKGRFMMRKGNKTVPSATTKTAQAKPPLAKVLLLKSTTTSSPDILTPAELDTERLEEVMQRPMVLNSGNAAQAQNAAMKNAARRKAKKKKLTKQEIHDAVNQILSLEMDEDYVQPDLNAT